MNVTATVFSMILVDAVPLVVLLHSDDQHHATCVAALKAKRESLSTVWSASTEALDLLPDLAEAQDALCEILHRGAGLLLPLQTANVPPDKKARAQICQPRGGSGGRRAPSRRET